MSPGTTSAEGISTRTPPRSTLAVGEDMAFRLSRDFSALKCWTVPKMALRMRTAKMTMVLSRLPETAEMTAATSRMTTSRSWNCSRKTWRPDFFLPSARAFLPNRSSRSAAWAEVRPVRADSTAFRVSSGVRLKKVFSMLHTPFVK